ncbi:MAG: HDIG domain-containing metalloprotein [Syntrophales bacterium]
MNIFKVITEKYIPAFKKWFSQSKNIPAFINNRRLQLGFLLVLLSLLFTFLLIPTVPFSRPEYKVGAIANKDIKADRDFLVEERASTDLKRIEAAKAIPSVYDFDDHMATQIRGNLMKAFLAVQESRQRTTPDDENISTAALAVNKEGRPGIFEKSLEIRLSDEELSVLEQHEFSSDLAEKISSLIVDVYRNRMITNAAFLAPEHERGIIVKNIRTLTETQENNISNIHQIDDVRKLLNHSVKAIIPAVNPELRKTAVSLAGKLLQPSLTYNREATEIRRRAAMDAVKPISFEVQKNEMIVREGEKITITDLDKINAFFKQQRQQKTSMIAGFAGMFLLILTFATALLFLTQKGLSVPGDPASQNRLLLCLAVIMVFQFLLIKAVIFISGAIHQSFPFLSTETILYASPFAVGTLLTGYLFSRQVALIFSIFICFLIAFMMPSQQTYLTLFAFLGFIIVIYKGDHYRRRTVFIRIGLFLSLMNMVAILAVSLLTGQQTSYDTLLKLLAGFTGAVMSGIIVAGVGPIFESLFGFTTEIRLMELANLNQPIFQRMIIEAPGSYHHSIIVGSMVEAAAEAIGADSILCKVSAYYHDIGKMKKPLYFIENQGKGENRHDKLSPRMSSLVIISHVKDGCELASTCKLGRKITDIIRQHHGTSLVGYFYEKAKRDKEPSIRALPESHFRYPGPRPQTKEAGLVLLGDVIEASSRTLVQPTPSRIQNLVRDRIDKVFMDGQLDECDLTLKDLNLIQESFVRILNGVFHHRVTYYDDINGQTNSNDKIKSVYDYPDRKSTEKNHLKPQADSQ